MSHAAHDKSGQIGSFSRELWASSSLLLSGKHCLGSCLRRMPFRSVSVEGGWSVGVRWGSSEMGSVEVQKMIILWCKTKKSKGLVLLWVLRLRSRSLRFRCYCYCFLVLGRNNVLFCLSWFWGSVYAGWISGVRLWVYSFVRTLGNNTYFHSQLLDFSLSLSTVI